MKWDLAKECDTKVQMNQCLPKEKKHCVEDTRKKLYRVQNNDEKSL